MVNLFQVGGDVWSSTIWFFLLIVFFNLFYPRLMLMQIILKLEKSALMVEGFTTQAEGILIRKITKKPKKELKKRINDFLEFFMIEPVNLDPYGIVNKIEHILDLSEESSSLSWRRLLRRLTRKRRQIW